MPYERDLSTIKETGSKFFDISAIDETGPSVDTRLIQILKSTYAKYRTGKIAINIKSWHDVADPGETLKILTRVECDDLGSIGGDDDCKIKTITEGTDDEDVVFVDELELGVDMEVYAYCGAVMDDVDDFTLTWHYLLFPLD